MVYRFPWFMRRAIAALGKKPPNTAMSVSEAQLRAMSHEELVTYAMQLQRQAGPESSNLALDGHPQTDLPRSPPRKKQKSKRQFDMARYGQRLIALKFVYFGWSFHGFASQPDSENTVEHHLFAALTKAKLITDRQSCMYSRAGRTDVGVSAMGQVVGLRVRSNIVAPSEGAKELPYVTVLNSCLPPEIRVLAWTPVSDGTDQPLALPGDSPEVHAAAEAIQKARTDPAAQKLVRRPDESFSARFDALHRSYKYFFVRGMLNISAMRKGGSFFEGTHNFRNFCKADQNITNFTRHMYSIQVRRAADHHASNQCVDDADGEHTVYYIFVKGQAFLWHQVRCMAAVLFEVGRGREQPDVIRQMLDDVRTGKGAFAKGKPQYKMASPLPLLLHDCAYPPSVVSFPAAALCIENSRSTPFSRADADLAESYAAVRLQAAVVREMLSSNDAAPVRYFCDIAQVFSEKQFADIRNPRNYLPHTCHSSKHVPLNARSKEPHSKHRKQNT